jgi:hypothetical protein
VEYLNQTYKLNIPESDSYGTLGGFIVILLTISVKGSDRDRYLSFYEEATNKKIELVKLTVKE